MHRCHEKGPNGSPTYDSAGFQLDYQKVAESHSSPWPKKTAMIQRMNVVIASMKFLEEMITKVFFDDTEENKKSISGSMVSIDLAKDKISKDLGIPFHKIGREEVMLWEQKGFEKLKMEDWMTYSEEDKKRWMKMLSGGKFRK